DREVGVALVVSVPHVEPGVELLDPGVLQLECFHLGADDSPVNGRRGGQHGLGPRMQAGEIGEIGVQRGPEVLALAYVDNPAMSVTEPVDPGGLGDRAGSWPVAMWICHPATLCALSGRRARGDRRAP